jgi:transposase
MACGKPEDFGVPYRHVWTLDSLHETLGRQIQQWGGAQLSRSSVVRILNDADLKPHKMRMWLHSPDPEFRSKVTEICELYRTAPQGGLVLCVDEKTGMQALGRKHPTRRPAPNRAGRIDYEYIRNGTRKLLAAFNPHTGEVYGQVREHRKAQDLVEFMDELAKRHPAGEVHIVWDNLNIHYDGSEQRWTKFNQRHGHRFHFHYTPLHASWVNQIELFFGILQRRVLRHGVFDSLEELDRAVLGFIEHWNAHEQHPFLWTFKGYPLLCHTTAAA